MGAASLRSPSSCRIHLPALAAAPWAGLARWAIAAAAAALALLGGASEAAWEVAPDHPLLRYQGRWNFDDPKTPSVGWQGSSVGIRFRGSKVVAALDSGRVAEQYRVIVDGQPAESALSSEPGRREYVLAEGLAAEQAHSVELMKETHRGTRTTLYGFRVFSDDPGAAANEPLEWPPRPDLRIAFFGDSNMDGTSLYSEKDRGPSGTWYAYPATASRMLGAEMNLQAYGGATLVGTRNNDVAAFIHGADRHTGSGALASDFKPQVIVVNAGANDIHQVDGERAAAQKARVKANYRTVIRALRAAYGPMPHIVLYNAYGWSEREPANYSREVAAEVGGNLSVLLYPWMWEQWHGSMVEHAGQARLLAQHIESLGLGFEVLRDAEVFDGFGRGFDVANGSFEFTARGGFDAFGWRYREDGVAHVLDPARAAHGERFIRLDAGEEVHQGVDATGDFEPGAAADGQGYVVTAMIRAASADAVAVIAADFEGQALYQRRHRQSRELAATRDWRRHRVAFTAPAGSWKIYVVLQALAGTVAFDDVRMAPL